MIVLLYLNRLKCLHDFVGINGFVHTAKRCKSRIPSSNTSGSRYSRADINGLGKNVSSTVIANHNVPMESTAKMSENCTTNLSGAILCCLCKVTDGVSIRKIT